MSKGMRWDRAKRVANPEAIAPRSDELYSAKYVASKSGPVRSLTPAERARLNYGPPRLSKENLRVANAQRKLSKAIRDWKFRG